MLLLAFIGDMLQYAVRIVASVLEHPNLSTHLVSLSMLVNRFGAALGLLLIGYSIDTGVTAATLIVAYAVFVSLLGLLYLLNARYSKFSVLLLRPFVTRYYKLEVTQRDFPVCPVEWRSPRRDIAILFAVSLFGFLLPSLAAAAFPAYRATLLQSGFILNSFATLYFALKIEKELAITLNTGSEMDKWHAYVSFMYARATGCLVASLTLLLMLFVA
jgi:hypothetical protein